MRGYKGTVVMVGKGGHAVLVGGMILALSQRLGMQGALCRMRGCARGRKVIRVTPLTSGCKRGSVCVWGGGLVWAWAHSQLHHTSARASHKDSPIPASSLHKVSSPYTSTSPTLALQEESLHLHVTCIRPPQTRGNGPGSRGSFIGGLPSSRAEVRDQ